MSRLGWLFGLVLLSAPAMAQDMEEDENWDGAPLVTLQAKTLFPLSIGVGLDLHASPQVRAGLDFGVTPKPYARTIGATAAAFGGRDDYEPLIRAAFEDAIHIRTHVGYALRDDNLGWIFELGLAQLSAKGEVGVSDIARIHNDPSYRVLEAALAADGAAPEFTMKSKLIVLDIVAKYQMALPAGLHAAFGAGLAKVLAAETDLSSSIPGFDSSRLGQGLLGIAEGDTSSSIEDHGFSPLVSLEISKTF